MRRVHCLLTACLLSLPLGLTGCSSLSSQTTQEQGGTAAYSGEDYLDAGDYETAASTYQSAIDAGQDTELNYRGLGIAQMGLGNYADAATAFENALDHAGVIPGSLEYDINYYLGSCYDKEGDYESALSVYDAIVTLRPRDTQALLLRGTVEGQLKDTDAMIQDFTDAIDLAPTDYDLIVDIAEKMKENGFEDQANETLNNILTKQADTISAYDKARLSYEVGDYESARDALESMGDSRDYSATILLGQTYEALGDYNYATSVYETYLTKDTTHAGVYNSLGLCCLAMADYQDALSAFQNGLALKDPSLQQALLYNQIVAEEYLGEFQRASVLMKEYLASYPTDEQAQREYTFLSTR